MPNAEPVLIASKLDCVEIIRMLLRAGAGVSEELAVRRQCWLGGPIDLVTVRVVKG